MQLDISDIAAAFPDFRVALVVFEGLAVGSERPEALDALIAAREAETRHVYAGTDLSAIPGVAAWRTAYRAFGIKKTSYRSSVERLVKNVLAERPLPRINPFVDAYNAVSLRSVMPIGADDADRVGLALAFRYARPGDSFVDMAGGEEGEGATPAEDPPKPGEVVYAAGSTVLCRRWNWRQDARSLVAPETRRAVVTVQANGVGDLDGAVEDLVSLVARFCGGTAAVAIADRDRPVASVSA
ncbi:B3/B4 domain-containing protein [Prosthecomicrobium pneumaticum]|uniref:DNA/RNA-binding domain of Phe-tRNA-synthetase-like protein n=1 Tax=Prosthecomicrobium pneumaticum TaxID=81895 RepID=A0A7W9FLQ3_9HYPH|nr:phenylalanine--tRNA ligase beta subunit-related protein [Prosthecomicrobium pneumaticum]MBB5752985.1 DNA/RNA-binding domain of Phe-tRNA-synthetase-like protein [Prosthecomicrobium pneumaticum]